MKMARVTVLWLLGTSVVTGLFAQKPVSHLQDLVGAKGRDGERQMEERGYTWVHTEKSEDSAYSYWRDNRDGRCVSIETKDGRYAEIVYMPELACQRGESSETEEEYDRQDEFETVCGVALEGKIHRQRCRVIDYYRGEKKWRTDLRFPDQMMRLRWQNEKMVTVRVEGVETRRAEYRSAEGDTNFFLDDKTYFYTFDKEKAKLELADLDK